MKKDNVKDLVNSIIFGLEKIFILNQSSSNLIEAYLNLLLFLIRKYGLYEKIDLFLSFVLQYNKYSKSRLKAIIKWILFKVMVEIDDVFLRSRIYYAIARIFFSFGDYNKAQNFAIKSLKIFYSIFDEKNNYHFLHYFSLILLISKLAFYRGKYYVSYNLLQHLFSRLLSYNLEDVFESNFIYSLLESSLWLVISYLYVNKNNLSYENVEEVINYFLDIVNTFSYIDTERVKEMISNVLLKNLKKMVFLLKSGKKIKKFYEKLINLANYLYESVQSIPNFGKIFISLYKEYIINFMILYPDNYKLANKFVLKSIYLNYYYIRSSNLVALSKFLLFKIMKLQNIYTNLDEYMKMVDIYEYILNNSQISEEVEKDIVKKRMVYIE
ncbi:MAG: hypothetical protein ACK4GR_04095 [bacterium]